MPRPNYHLSLRIQNPLYCCLQRRWGEEDASIPWIDRETLHLLTADWLTSDAEHAVLVSLPDRSHPALVQVKVLESYDGGRNPFGMGVLNVCGYRVPAFRDEVALDKFLRSLDPDLDAAEISGPISYSGRADIVDALRGHLRGPRSAESIEDPPSTPGHDRIAIADELLATPMYSRSPRASLYCQFDDWGPLKAALRSGQGWVRLVVRAVPQVEVMDDLDLVMRLPDGVMVQLPAKALKVRRGRLLLQADKPEPWAVRALSRATA